MTTHSQMGEEVEAKILRQVEFYFSDSNLPRDRFLLRSIEESEDGLVSLAVVSSFSRMRNLLGLKEPGADKVPSEVLSKVADVLRKSSQLRLSDDGLRVGRASKLLKPEEVQAEVDARSIAATPLPWNVTMDQVESFFSQIAKVKSVRLYRHPGSKVFSGVAVIEVSSEEEARKVLEMKLVFEGAELELQHKNDFDETLQDKFSTANEMQHSDDNVKRATGGLKNERKVDQVEDFPKGVIISFKLVPIQKADDNGAEAERNADNASVDEKSTDEKSADSSKEAPETGISAASADQKSADEKCADSSKEAPDKNVLSREDIKEVLGKYGTIRFIDFSRGDTSGYVRFESPDASKKARAAAVLASEGGLVIKGFLANLEAVEGEAEEAYWKKVRGSSGGRGFDSRRRGRVQYGFGGGRRGRGRGRGRGRDDVQPTTLGKHTRFEDKENGVPAKAQKTE